MGNVVFKIGNWRFDLSLVILLLIISIPFFNFFGFFGFQAKLIMVSFVLVVLALSSLSGKFQWNKSIILNVFILIMSILAMLNNFPDSLEYYTLLLLGFFLIRFQCTENSIITVLKVIEWIGLFYALTLFWQYFSPSSFYPVLKLMVEPGPYNQAIQSPIDAGDYTGFACESNRAGLCIAPAASILFTNFFFKPNNYNVITNTIKFGIVYLAIVLCGRRAFIVFFPFILVLVTLYFLLRNRRGSVKAFGLLLAVLLFIVFYVFLYDKLIDIITRGSGTEIALSNREVYWDLAISMFKENPLFGQGMRSYDFNYNLISNRNIVFAGAHNSYLQIMAEMGVIGSVAFVILILYFLYITAHGALMAINHSDINSGRVFMASLLMQLMIVFLGLSEAALFAPFSITLYFFMLSVSFNQQRIVNSETLVR